ncbi:uncharacterized protein LOC129220108 [Uloborus diversus]|uniref:uncharacterized protein LOC129220108 n=1 Tax=Uloborus diversus TaxID=327109 RepID=UPI00240966D5|nr:uncharacterized protein LOC129220108 [Uloborus diversus]
MASGCGRKQASEWNEFTEFGTKVKCKHCETVVSKRAVRIKEHLKKCKRNIASRTIEETDIAEIEPPTKVPRVEECNNDCAEVPSSSKEQKQKSIFSYGVVTTASQKQNLDKSVARFFYANNIAFNVSSNVEFKKMVEDLRPGYVPPNRHQLSGKLLDEACDDIENCLKKELVDEAALTLILDGWSSVKNDPIFACSIHTGVKSYLFKAMDCGSEKKTAEFCANFAKETLEEVEIKYNKKVFAICTDNENKMTAMGNQIQETHQSLLIYGCSAHMLNLCVKDIIPNSLIKHVLEVQKYFRNKHNAHGWLKEKNGLMPQIPNDTRWNSQDECLRTFIINFHKYNEIRLEHLDEFDQQIGSILTNVGIYTQVVYLREFRIQWDSLHSLNQGLPSEAREAT